MSSPKPTTVNRYHQILAFIFKKHYRKGVDSFEWNRTEITDACEALGIAVPKNFGDVIYANKYRTDLPSAITETASRNHEWLIEPAGRGRYRFRLAKGSSRILPRENAATIKIPDSTPEIIAAHALSDEQAVLARVRYNRLIDTFLGITAYSLQNHLRTSVKDVGQIETDELYVAVNKNGEQFVIPVQAKGGKDQIAITQVRQDIALCNSRFPTLTCRPVCAQFMHDGVIALFELTSDPDEVKVVDERHYELVPADSITPEDLKRYKR